MNWIVIAQFDLAIEAHLAKGRLEASEIPVRIVDEHLVSNDWLLAGLLGGIKLEVPEGAAEAARSLLGLIEAQAHAADAAPTCPQCASQSVKTLEDGWLVTTLLVLVVVFTAGLALFFKRPRFTCQDCDQRWG